MYRNEGGELTHGSFKVVFGTKVSPRITMDTIEPWLVRNADRMVSGRLGKVSAEYAGAWHLDAIDVAFDCGFWFGEASLDRDQAGALYALLGEAIAAYDEREPRRQQSPATHHLVPMDEEWAEIERKREPAGGSLR
jgi:hypothetical protein